MVNANSPDGYSSDTTNPGLNGGEKTDTMSKRNLKTNIINVCKSEAGCINEQT